MRLDALIFGGGAAGLWLLDRLSRDGHHVLLLESSALGAGQTVASQGILHSTATKSPAKAVRNQRSLTQIWQNSLLGRATPNLSKTRLRSGHCFRWWAEPVATRSGKTDSLFSSIDDYELLSENDRPDELKSLAGPVARVPELVIDPRSLIEDFADQYADRILLIDDREGLEFKLDSPGEVKGVKLVSPSDGSVLELHPRQVILTAGSGNARLRKLAGLSSEVVQRRTLQVVLVRGDLPEFNGYSFDGEKQLLVTSIRNDNGQVTWQVGGAIAEEAPSLDSKDLMERAYRVLSSLLPTVDLLKVEWASYMVDRVEAATMNGKEPQDIQVLCAGNVTTGWPTKLVLAPVLAEEIARRAASPYFSAKFDTSPFAKWPRPAIAQFPWTEPGFHWSKRDTDSAAGQRRAA